MLPWSEKKVVDSALGIQYVAYSRESLGFKNNHEVHRAKMQLRRSSAGRGGERNLTFLK